MTAAVPRRRRVPGPRSAARLAAVQALYEMDIAGARADPVLRDFMENRWRSAADEAGGEGGAEAPAPDREFLSRLVRGVAERADELDRLIAAALKGQWTPERLEILLKAILRAGAYELLALDDVPPKVVINEYVEVAGAFYTANEARMVNAVLDHLARTLRKDEMEGPKGGGRPERR